MLGGHGWGDGATPTGGDDLIAVLLRIALASRTCWFRIPIELGLPDMRLLECVYEFGEIAAAGGDIRDRVFGGRRVEPA